MAPSMINASARPEPPPMNTQRGPSRSASQPSGGLDSPCTSANAANAPATSERLQWNSSASATRKTEYEYQTPYASPSVTKVAMSDWVGCERTLTNLPTLMRFTHEMEKKID